VRTGPVKIILQKLRNLTINRLKLYLELKNTVICCYGFTQDPKDNSYYIVLKYANGGNLQRYIQNKLSFSWFEKLSILKKIIELLHKIHKINYVHHNLHSRNILLYEDDLNHKLEIYVSDLDLCVYSDYKMRRDDNVLYTIPEIMTVSTKSDIYRLSFIMQELVSGDPFNLEYSNVPKHSNIPQCYLELKEKCMDIDPEKRPDTLDLLEELHIFTTSPLRKREFEAADHRSLQQPLTLPPALLPALPPVPRTRSLPLMSRSPQPITLPPVLPPVLRTRSLQPLTLPPLPPTFY
jgi:serine/threonine protein kinase